MELEAYINQTDLQYIFKDGAGKQYKKYINLSSKIIKNFYKSKTNYYNFIEKL